MFQIYLKLFNNINYFLDQDFIYREITVFINLHEYISPSSNATAKSAAAYPSPTSAKTTARTTTTKRTAQPSPVQLTSSSTP